VEILPEQVCNLSTLGEILQRLRIVSLPEQEMKSVSPMKKDFVPAIVFIKKR
jgi:hypothetical protein